MEFWLMKWDWEKPSKLYHFWLTQHVKKVRKQELFTSNNTELGIVHTVTLWRALLLKFIDNVQSPRTVLY